MAILNMNKNPNLSFKTYLFMVAGLLVSLGALFSGPLAHAESVATEVIHYVGNAYDLNNANSLLYKEEHQLTLINGKPSMREVIYRSSTNELMVKKTNRYSENASAPEFDLQDLRSGYREQAHYNREGGLVLSVQENQQASVQTKTLNTLPNNLIIDAGFDDFVRKHWAELEAGKNVSFSFASAARLDLIDFRLLKKDSNENELVLSMRLKSRLLAWLLDPIELTYDKQSQRLMRYRGLSNIQDVNGDSYSADIRYQYK